MPRPNRSAEKREALLPVLAEAFASAGYTKATTAELARRCGVQETVLYRLWPDKKAMFLASIDHVFERSMATWTELLAGASASATGAERILAHEAVHHGEFGLYRVLFTGLDEIDDDEVREHLRQTYRKFQRYVRDRIAEHRAARRVRGGVSPDAAAWAILGLGTIASIGRELGLLTTAARRELLAGVGRALLESTR
ncbi:MAG TPA: TetR/AcrR family transcriptional regulator [Candidatus Polarisedimenticolaceae bacterium]|nr:TetR/AcrR family transcriptional regulator [Candidatus Polarisedimenticolaceae bacterium]